MPRKQAKGKPDAAQRTLLQYHSFKKPRDMVSSPSKTTNSHLVTRTQADTNVLHSNSSALPREQAISNRPREIPLDPPQMPQASSVRGPIDCRSIAKLELRRAMATLNCEQKAAVGAPLSSPIAVFAGAGTGKTTALIARIWNMLAQGVKPESVLAITFTRKACQEIKDRLSVENLGCKIPVGVFTFHGWAVRFLRSKQVREMAGVPQKLVIWAQREQKEHMAQACQRARVDHDLLPQARRLMDLPATGQLSPDESWKELLRKAFTDPSILKDMLIARQRAKDRVHAALKEVGILSKDVDGEGNFLETETASVAPRDHERHHAGVADVSVVKLSHSPVEQQYGSLSGPAAAPGASTHPSARMRHVRATTKALDPTNAERSDSEAEEAEVGNEYLKDDHRSNRSHWVDEMFPDGSVDSWTLVAKELLTTYCRQECGIEIIIKRQGRSSGADVNQEIRHRMIQHRQHFLFHKAPVVGAPAHDTKLDQKLLTSKALGLLQFRAWIRKNNAEGLEPETFQTVANQYYDARMKLLGALDFDEMLAKAEQLLSTSSEACSIARNMYQELLVDEFQDSNAVQIRIVKHLQDGRGHLTVVGDDAQSIYGFRGATNRAFDLLKEVLEDNAMQEYSMTQNYRSLSPIIEVGNYVLQPLMSNGALRPKDLTCTRTSGAVPVQYHELGTGLSEARFIVTEIQRLHEEGFKYDDMAIICRLNNNKFLFPYEFGVLHHIKMQLAKDSIPHRVFRGRQMTDKPEYILTVDVLKFLANPLNDGALLAILESKLSMRSGIGESVITQLKKIARDAHQPIPVWQSLQDLVRRHDTATRKRNAVQRLIDWHSRVYGEVMFKALPDALLYIWNESGISALAAKTRQGSASASPPNDDPDKGSIPGHSKQPDATLSRQESICMSQHSGFSVGDAIHTPVHRGMAARGPGPDVIVNMVLTSPTLEALHRNSQEFLSEWTEDALFLEHFGDLRLASSSIEHPQQPGSLLSLATAAVIQLPQPQRVKAVNILATSNPGLADVILSVNKCGYGPVAEFVQHLDLNSSDVAEEDQADAQTADGKVTLSTVHGCKGLEWPVVFVPKFIDNVMPLQFFAKRAIPIDGDEEASCEAMAIAAVQADARMRGQELKTHDDVVAYLPAWLKQDGIEPDTDIVSGSDSDTRIDITCGGEMDAERVSTCYKRKKEKQHNEEEIRLAHVAFTRAKDRLYVTSHRIAEGSADASSLEAARASKTRTVKRVFPSQSISLLNNSEFVNRTCHPVDTVEEYLSRCASENEMQQGFGQWNSVHRARSGMMEGSGAEGAAFQPLSAAVAAAEEAVQIANEHATSGFQFMGAVSAGRHRGTCHPSSGTLARSRNQCPAEDLHARDRGAASRLPGVRAQRATCLSDSDDEPLQMRKRAAPRSMAGGGRHLLPPNMGSTSKPELPDRHDREHAYEAVGSGSPVALSCTGLAAHRVPARKAVADAALGQNQNGQPASNELPIDLTSPRMGVNTASDSRGTLVADRMPACKALGTTQKVSCFRSGQSGNPKGSQFRAPRKLA